MATRLKTIKYAFPATASMANNTLTTLTQITIDIPETVVNFRSVTADISMDDIITATGGSMTTKTFNLRLGAASYTSVANGNTLTNSGENISPRFTADYTSHFTTNWTGTSMTCDFQLQINQSTGTTTGMVNICVELIITYEYDDTATTHVKTVEIPLNAPTSFISTSATTYDTIPVLDTYLPEDTKTYKSIYLVLKANEQRNGTSTDNTVTINVGSATVTTGNYEGALASDRAIRYVYNLTSTYPSTGSTQDFQLSSTVARFNHPQAYLVVTYTFDESSTTSVMNSLKIPTNINSPMGGTTSSDYQRGSIDLNIQESTISTNRIAFYSFWQQAANISTLNFRLGASSFTSYNDAGVNMCGTAMCMVRDDSAFTLARGINTLNVDVYRSDTSDFGWNVSGYFIVNYTSDKHADGVGAHNHTVQYNISTNGTAAAASYKLISATSVQIPETEYFISNLGINMIVIHSGNTAPPGFTLLVERLSGEGGIEWEPAYIDVSVGDPEVGYFEIYGQMRNLFKRFTGDADPIRIDLETSRRWYRYTGNAASWSNESVIMTYHTIDYTVSGTVSNSDAGTVNLSLHRSNGNSYRPGELLKTTTRTGDGSYSFTWYDNTQNVFVASEDGTGGDRTLDGVAT